MVIWSDLTADVKIGKYVKERDNYTCFFCGRRAPEVHIDPSHFFRRGVSSTRFDPDNIDAVCRECHSKHENNKNGLYRQKKIQQLGEKRFKDMENRFHRGRQSRREAIYNLMIFLQ